MQDVSNLHIRLVFLPGLCIKYIYHTGTLAVAPEPKSKLKKHANRDGLFTGSSHTYTHHPRHHLLSNIEDSDTLMFNARKFN